MSENFEIWVTRAIFRVCLFEKRRIIAEVSASPILIKVGRKNKLLKTVGCAKTNREEELLILLARTEMARLEGSQTLFEEYDDLVVGNFVNSIANDHLRVVGTELILGKIYQKIGFLMMGAPIILRTLFYAGWYL